MTDGLSPDIFLQEARDLLGEVEAIVFDLESAPGDRDALDRLFRTMHTIKGSGAMFGFDAVAEFTHHVESALDCVRKGEIDISKPLIDLVFSAADHIERLLEAPDAAAEGAGEALIDALKRLTPAEPRIGGPVVDKGTSERGEEPRTYAIRFQPDPDILKSGMDPARLLDDLRQLGPCEVSCHTDATPPLTSLDPERCSLSWDIRLTADVDADAIHDVFLFVSDDSHISVQQEAAAQVEPTNFPEAPKKESEPPPDAPPDAPHDAPRSAAAPASIRVSSEKLDQLINLVGELIITEERIREIAAQFEEIEKIKLLNMVSNTLRGDAFSPTRRSAIRAIWQHHGMLDDHLDPLNILESLAAGMTGPIETLKRLTGELRDTALNMRMVEIGTVFGKLRRLVRDLSRELGKEVELITEGGDAELDKTLIDRLNDPLVHLIRNSVDHGIQRPDVREAAGKPRKGTLRLTAFHREAQVVITVADDGQGIDTQALRTKAIQAGLLSEGEDLPEAERLKLIFQPGLTTAGKVTKVSGRGVGMDVVKREIDAMGGTIAIDSRRGEHCRFTISLPLTLAIINGLLVEAGGEQFVLPMSQVAECTELTPQMHRNAQGRNLFVLRGDIVPFIRLNELFQSNPSPTAGDHVAIVEFEGTRVGLLVDAIIGDVQTVVKSLDQRCHRAECFSGATVLGDGRVALVLDISSLIECASHQTGAPTSGRK